MVTELLLQANCTSWHFELLFLEKQLGFKFTVDPKEEKRGVYVWDGEQCNCS